MQEIIFIGGGLQVEDDQGKILLAYRPQDIRYPLGDIKKREITFAIPKKSIGSYQEEWQFIVMIGAQDDHGGGGIGEFRNVGKVASDWTGGGGEADAGNCNVYDLLFIE